MTMTRFQLNSAGTYAKKVTDDPTTAEWHNTQNSAEYLAWLEAGNTPEPAPEPEPVPELTPAEKLAASGLTVEELKQLLGLS
jgi:hypothetical protein